MGNTLSDMFLPSQANMNTEIQEPNQSRGILDCYDTAIVAVPRS